MKKIFVLALAALFSAILTAQNVDGFEEWEYVNEWEVPVGWDVNNTFEVFPCSVKEEGAFSGEYALRLRSYGPSFEGFASGLATRKFYIMPDEGLLSIQVKVDSLLPGGFASIRVMGKASNYTTPIGEWQATERSEDFEHLEILLDGSSLPDSVMVILESGTTPGPLGFDGYTEIVVDQLEFVLNVSGQKKAPRDNVARIFPVPVQATATVELQGLAGAQQVQLELLDAAGRLVLQAAGKAPQFTFHRSGLPAGVYAYRLLVGGSVIQAGRIVLR